MSVPLAYHREVLLSQRFSGDGFFGDGRWKKIPGKIFDVEKAHPCVTDRYVSS